MDVMKRILEIKRMVTEGSGSSGGSSSGSSSGGSSSSSQTGSVGRTSQTGRSGDSSSNGEEGKFAKSDSVDEGEPAGDQCGQVPVARFRIAWHCSHRQAFNAGLRNEHLHDEAENRCVLYTVLIHAVSFLSSTSHTAPVAHRTNTALQCRKQISVQCTNALRPQVLLRKPIALPTSVCTPDRVAAHC